MVDELRGSAAERALFDDLVGDRIAAIDVERDDEELTAELVRQVNKLTTDGAARLVVAAGDGADGAERRIRRILLRKFPRHLLGSVPILYSSEFTTDRVRSRRIWSSVLNSFLHPTMERFLYNAEDRLRSHRVKNPLLIYRNDGASSRVAKSVALKTYSSGPRGGLEGTRALAQAYGLGHVLMIDVGGTTTDVGSVRKEEILTNRRGSIEGVTDLHPDERRAIERSRRELRSSPSRTARSLSARKASGPPPGPRASDSAAPTPPSPMSTCCSGSSIRTPTSTAGSHSTPSGRRPRSARCRGSARD